MRHWLLRIHAHVFTWRYIRSGESLALLLILFVFVSPASAAMRLQDRSLYINSSVPGAKTSYTVSMRYMSPVPVGSVDMLFCVDPIPYHACVTPPGLDASAAILDSQSGEVGFAISHQSPNRIILTRPPSMITASASSYKLNNVVNPTDTSQSYSIRLRTHSSVDTTGPQIDFGSVVTQVTDGIILETQVPPMLIFCVAQQVEDNCTDTNKVNYADLGDLTSDTTLLTQSQMAVGTNATAGFAITANGTALSAGTSVIGGLAAPTESRQGSNQFGLNLVANDNPSVGNNPEGPWTNAVPTSDYNTPNLYKYVPGDVIAYSPNVSLMKKFTVSYVVNSSSSLRAGVYSTTITYIASGRF